MRILAFAFCFITCTTLAQTKKAPFYIAPSIGLAVHQSIDMHLQLSGGVKLFKKLDLGLGIGRNEYNTVSTPLFIETKTYLSNYRKTNLFVYGNAGINIPGNIPYDRFGASNTYLKNGYYADAGLGYTITNRKKPAAIFVTAGYSRKTYSRAFEETNYPSGLKSTHSFKYTFNFISVKTGVRIGK